jgi:hypothetical protein
MAVATLAASVAVYETVPHAARGTARLVASTLGHVDFLIRHLFDFGVGVGDCAIPDFQIMDGEKPETSGHKAGSECDPAPERAKE